MHSLKPLLINKGFVTEEDKHIFKTEIHEYPDRLNAVVHYGADLYRDGYYDGVKRTVLSIGLAYASMKYIVLPIADWWDSRLKRKKLADWWESRLKEAEDDVTEDETR